MPLVWSKTLSRTDAQQETAGRIVPYLRLTRGEPPRANFQSWFRETFFADLAWHAGLHGQTPVEEAFVQMDTTTMGTAWGPLQFRITHGETRMDSHDHPNTWVHWPDELQQWLSQNSTEGMLITMTRNDDDTFTLTI